MKHYLTTLFIILSISAKSQNFLPASITFLNGKTDSGFIDKKVWSTNPSKIKFKDLNGKENTYTPDDLQSFEVSSYKYVRAVVTIDQNSVDITDKFSGTDTSIVETVFLKVLVSGTPLNLYQYIDFKSHYYINTDSSKIEELKYRLYDNQFQKQILNTKSITWNNELYNMVNVLDYNETDLTRFVKKVNTVNTYSDNSSLTFKERLSWFAGGGIAYQNMKVTSPFYRDYNDLTIKSVVNPIISAGLDFYVLKNQKNLAIRLQLSYYDFKTKGTYNNTTQNFNITYELQQRNIIPSVGMAYNFVNTPTCKIYGSLNFALILSEYVKNNFKSFSASSGITINNGSLPFSKKWTAVPIQFGSVIHDKFDVRATAFLFGSFLETPVFSEKGLKSSLQILYRF